MEVPSATSTPVSNTLDPAPPRDNRGLSSPQSNVQAVSSPQQADASSSAAVPDPTARVGGQIDTYV